MRSTCLKCYGSALETLEAGLYNAARRPIPRPALPVGCDLPQRSYSTSLPLFQTLQTLHPPPLPASSPDLLPTSSTPPTASPPVTSINRRYIPAWTVSKCRCIWVQYANAISEHWYSITTGRNTLKDLSTHLTSHSCPTSLFIVGLQRSRCVLAR